MKIEPDPDRSTLRAVVTGLLKFRGNGIPADGAMRAHNHGPTSPARQVRAFVGRAEAEPAPVIEPSRFCAQTPVAGTANSADRQTPTPENAPPLGLQTLSLPLNGGRTAAPRSSTAAVR